MAKPRFRVFFTPVGAAVLVIALIILVRSLIARNAYEMLLSSLFLLLMLLLGIIGMWKSKKFNFLEPGWKPPYPMVAGSGSNSSPWLVTGLGVHVPLFFRLHFVVRGKFSPAGYAAHNSCPVFAETSLSKGKDIALLNLNFPMSGVFMGNGFSRLCDIFGLYSFSCGVPQQRTVKVRSAPCIEKKLFVNAQSGAEDKRNKTSSDEERYYMREYTPGDRFRDINWKSSEKIDALITRISPDNQEKVSRIDVYFRNYGPVRKTSLEALWLLDRSKSRLTHFLRSLLEENSSFIFNVHASHGQWEIHNNDDLENFLEELAGLSFALPQNEAIALPGKAASEMFVFSTSCDTELNSFLLANSPRPFSLFFIQPANAIKGHEISTLYKRNFLANGCIVLPRWFIKSKIKQAGIGAGKVEMLYAETRL